VPCIAPRSARPRDRRNLVSAVRWTKEALPLRRRILSQPGMMTRLSEACCYRVVIIREFSIPYKPSFACGRRPT
jgi:hypothetical protein